MQTVAGPVSAAEAILLVGQNACDVEYSVAAPIRIPANNPVKTVKYTFKGVAIPIAGITNPQNIKTHKLAEIVPFRIAVNNCSWLAPSCVLTNNVPIIAQKIPPPAI